MSSENLSEPKPSPIPYLHAVNLLNLKVEDCIAVEDSPPGLQSALQAGLDTVAIAGNFSAALLKTPILGNKQLSPIAICASMTDFFNLLKI